jgi:cyclase
MSVRIISRLDIKGPNLVKGVQLEGLRVLGRPEDFARHYYEEGADELIYMDVVASLYGRNSLLPIIERTSQQIFIPLTVGGGLRTVDDIRAVLRAGADKVSLNTAAVRNPDLIEQAAKTFGSSTIVVSIDAIDNGEGAYKVYIDYGRERTAVDAFEWAVRAAELGAGELLVTSISREGTGTGFDLQLTRQIAESVSVPVIASGGAGKVSHVFDAVESGRADAVAIASLLHYEYVRTRPHVGGELEEGNVDFLKQPRKFGNIDGASLVEVKESLIRKGLYVRPRESVHV